MSIKFTLIHIFTIMKIIIIKNKTTAKMLLMKRNSFNKKIKIKI